MSKSVPTADLDPAVRHRPTDREAMRDEARRLAALGLRPADLARIFAISEQALHALLTERPT